MVSLNRKDSPGWPQDRALWPSATGSASVARDARARARPEKWTPTLIHSSSDHYYTHLDLTNTAINVSKWHHNLLQELSSQYNTLVMVESDFSAEWLTLARRSPSHLITTQLTLTPRARRALYDGTDDSEASHEPTLQVLSVKKVNPAGTGTDRYR